jgi:hypothetical protein
MARKLTTFVHAVEANDRREITNQGVFGPDDDLPDWARKAITNPNVWDGDQDDDAPAPRGRRGPAKPDDDK